MSVQGDTAPIIEEDVPCIGCGYNLRTLPSSGACSECGRDVFPSAWFYKVSRSEEGPLRLNHVGWLREMRRGLAIASVAWTAAFTGLLYEGFSARSPPWREAWPGVLWLTPHIATWSLSFWAAWTLAAPRRSAMPGSPDAGGVGWSRLTRTVVVVGVASLGLIFINQRWHSFYFEGVWRMWEEPAYAIYRFTPVAGGLGMLAWPVVTALTFSRLALLAWLARKRGHAGVLAVMGLAATFANGAYALLALSTIGTRTTLASGGISCGLVGPSGTSTGLWMLVMEFISRIALNSSVPLRSLDDQLYAVMLAAAVVLSATLGLTFLRISQAVTRAIELSEPPADPAPQPATPHPN